MKKITPLLAFILVPFLLTAQSVLITPGAQSINGDSTIQNQLNAFGNGLLVGPKVKFTDEDPASNVHIMDCGTTTFSTSTAGTLKDPSGDSDYLSGFAHDCEFRFYSYNPLFLAFQIDFEVLDTEAAEDTVFIMNGSTVLVSYSGNSLPPSLRVSNDNIIVRFKTNSTVVGAGFVLTWKAILIDETPAPIQNYSGEGLVYDVAYKSLWAGKHNPLDFQNRGSYSTATGWNTDASGYYSMAMGKKTTASGYASTAMGDNTEASGYSSTAMGEETEAAGSYSTSMGYNTTASGDNSTAIGTDVTITGDGSIFIGDSNPGTDPISTRTFNDRFYARFKNGYYFLTSESGSSDLGVRITNNQTAWSSISDSTKKENFIPANGDAFLEKLKDLKLGSWNYKTNEANPERFYGPMAQEVFAAYGKDAKGTIGSDTLVSTLNMDGLLFIFAQELEKRTSDLKRENEVLKSKVEALDEKYKQNLLSNSALKNDFDQRISQLEELLTSKSQGDLAKQP